MVLHAKLRLEQNLYKVDRLLEFMMGLDCLYIPIMSLCVSE